MRSAAPSAESRTRLELRSFSIPGAAPQSVRDASRPSRRNSKSLRRSRNRPALVCTVDVTSRRARGALWCCSRLGGFGLGERTSLVPTWPRLSNRRSVEGSAPERLQKGGGSYGEGGTFCPCAASNHRCASFPSSSRRSPSLSPRVEACRLAIGPRSRVASAHRRRSRSLTAMPSPTSRGSPAPATESSAWKAESGSGAQPFRSQERGLRASGQGREARRT